MRNADVQTLFSGVELVTISYSGSGDSGAIDTIEATRPAAWRDGGDRRTLNAEQKAEIERRVYQLLEDLPDWYNNEGGFGEATFDVVADEIVFNHSVNNTRVDSHSRQFSKTTLPAPIKRALVKLPETTSAVLYERQAGAAHLLVLTDLDGRRIPYTPEDEASSIEADIEALISDEAQHTGAGEDNEEDELTIDVRKQTAELSITWNVTESESADHTFTFSDDGDEPEDADDG